MNERHIELIEDLPINPNSKRLVLLVALGKKASALFSINSNVWREGDSPLSLDDGLLNRIDDVFDEIGIKHQKDCIESSDAGIIQPETGRTRLCACCSYFISLDQSVSDNLLESFKNNDHYNMGLALGFPKSAVDAFSETSKNTVLASSLDPEIRFSETAKFAQFALSKDNWSEEIAVAQEWLDVLKETSPLIYRECRKQLNVLQPDVEQRLIESYRNRPE